MANQEPTRGEIRRAQSQAVGGARKRCRKGKNCSAACIQAGMVCLVEMPESAGIATTRMRDYLKEWKPKKLEISPKLTDIGGDYAPIKRLTGEKLVTTSWKLAKEGKTPAEIVKATGYWNHEDLFNKAIKEYRPKPAQQTLVGDDLIKLIKSMPVDTPKADLVRAAGYFTVRSDGTEQLKITAFYDALLEARAPALFKEAKGYPFKQPIMPYKGSPNYNLKELGDKLGVSPTVASIHDVKSHRLMRAGASFSQKEGKPYIKVFDGGSAIGLETKVGKNILSLSSDLENTIMWRINGSIDKSASKEMTPIEKKRMALAAKKSWDILLRMYGDGEILTTSAYTGDGSGDSRAKAYQAVGFGKPYDNESGAQQFGQITKYGLKPLNPEEGGDQYNAIYDRLDDDDEEDDDNFYYAETQSEFSKQLDDKAIDDAFMVILFGDTGTEKI